MQRAKPSLAKGMIAGVAAGLIATMTMDRFQALLAASQKAVEKQQKLAAGESPWLIANEQAQQEIKEQQSEGSTEKLARRIAEAAGTYIPPDQRKAAGRALHYAFGTLMGTLYSTTAEWLPEVTVAGGTVFGTLLLLTADEVAVRALRLSAAPTDTPPAAHLQYWAAHLVYGSTLELARTLVRRLI